MSGGKHEMIHKWRTLGVVFLNGVNYFRYECKKCGIMTLNGLPIPNPHNKKCDKATVENLTG